MHPLEKETIKIVQLEQLLTAGEKVIIGVSGGPDSVALLHALSRLAPDLDITLAAVISGLSIFVSRLLAIHYDISLPRFRFKS